MQLYGNLALVKQTDGGLVTNYFFDEYHTLDSMVQIDTTTGQIKLSKKYGFQVQRVYQSGTLSAIDSFYDNRKLVTEFVHCNAQGVAQSRTKYKYDDYGNPVVAYVFGQDPSLMLDSVVSVYDNMRNPLYDFQKTINPLLSPNNLLSSKGYAVGGNGPHDYYDASYSYTYNGCNLVQIKQVDGSTSAAEKLEHRYKVMIEINK